MLCPNMTNNVRKKRLIFMVTRFSFVLVKQIWMFFKRVMANILTQHFFNKKLIMIQKHYWLIFAALFSIVLQGCEKADYDDIDETDVSSQKIDFKGVALKVVDGRIMINSIEDAAKLEDLISEDFIAAEDFFNQIDRFTSAGKAYSKITPEWFTTREGNITELKRVARKEIFQDGEEYVVPVIDDPAWSLVANEEAIFQVGEHIQYITVDTRYSIPMNFWETHSLSDILHKREVEKFPIHRKLVEVTMRANVDTCEEDYRDGNNNRKRVRGELEQRSSLFNNSIRCIVRTKHFTRVLFGWVGDNADFLEHNGCVELNINCNSVCYTVDKGLSNRQNIDTEVADVRCVKKSGHKNSLNFVSNEITKQ